MDIKEIFENEYISATLFLFILMYAHKAKMQLPDWILDLFKNDIFRIFFISLIAMIPAKQTPHVSLILAILFVIMMNLVNEKDTKEKIIQPFEKKLL